MGAAAGTLYLDDGESIEPESEKVVGFSFSDGSLNVRSWGLYPSGAALANITIAGLDREPRGLELKVGIHFATMLQSSYADGTLRITGLEGNTAMGAFEEDIELRVI